MGDQKRKTVYLRVSMSVPSLDGEGGGSYLNSKQITRLSWLLMMTLCSRLKATCATIDTILIMYNSTNPFTLLHQKIYTQLPPFFCIIEWNVLASDVKSRQLNDSWDGTKKNFHLHCSSFPVLLRQKIIANRDKCRTNHDLRPHVSCHLPPPRRIILTVHATNYDFSPSLWLVNFLFNP